MKRKYLIPLLTLMVSCEDQLDHSKVIRLRTRDDITSIPADNTSTLTVEALIDVNSDKDKREITFTTSEGVFIPGNTQELKITAKDTFYLDDKAYLGAKAVLKSSFSVSPSVVVTGDILQYKSRITNISFTKSDPVTLKLSSNVFGVHSTFDSEALLTAKLSSSTGIPSKGNIVKFRILDAATQLEFTEPRFREEKFSFDAEGLASVIFSAGNLKKAGSPFEGDLLVIAELINRPDLIDTLILNVSPKPE